MVTRASNYAGYRIPATKTPQLATPNARAAIPSVFRFFSRHHM